MRRALQVGDEAPNFDLASTEDVILMLRDEVPRTPVLLYFFPKADSERTRSDLASLKDAARELAKAGVKLFGVSPAGLDELKDLQRQLGLWFPLLHDDRKLARAYGVEDQDASEGSTVMALVGRDHKVQWIAKPAPPARDAVGQAIAALPGGSSSANYPRKVINRLVDRWVN